MNHVQMSFREALDEVFKSGKFLLREHEMEYALEISDFRMEKEVGFFFFSCADNLQSNAIFSLIIFLSDMIIICFSFFLFSSAIAQMALLKK